jgi:hypothetical protein
VGLPTGRQGLIVERFKKEVQEKKKLGQKKLNIVDQIFQKIIFHISFLFVIQQLSQSLKYISFYFTLIGLQKR